MSDIPLFVSRWTTGIVLFIAGIAAWSFGETYRMHEARLEAGVVNLLSPVKAVAQDGTAVVWTGMGTSDIMGFNITSACSSAALMGGFCVVTAILLVAWRSRTKAILFGAAIALTLILLTNLVRLSVVIGATRVWGRAGFDWTHMYLGTIVTVVGLFVAAGAYLFLLMREPSGAPARRKAHRA
ncbi:hypothetical protein [Nocardioides sp. AE5]|uniref:hypothetical protein n=1 Tax=Nocardioides sp. AE5 TaxID=2962573 RepID=UPI002881FE7E|nr:hypothetical protein [Nocardioides sp. AE5]MDT0203428.1 hypothetical protein [Nocardioides sp. AE5]